MELALKHYEGVSESFQTRRLERELQVPLGAVI
jgi:hypothetical protein